MLVGATQRDAVVIECGLHRHPLLHQFEVDKFFCQGTPLSGDTLRLSRLMSMTCARDLSTPTNHRLPCPAIAGCALRNLEPSEFSRRSFYDRTSTQNTVLQIKQTALQLKIHRTL